MKKLMVRENKKIGYYSFAFKRLGQKDLLNESFIFKTSFDSPRLSQEKIGEFAIFSADLLKNYTNAEKYFLQAINRDPSNSYWVGNYAIFLHFYKRDYKLAAKFYDKSLEIYEDDVFLKFNYIQLLVLRLKSFDKAEKLFKEVLLLEPKNAQFKCAYASFLFKIKKKFAQAEKICEDVITTSPENPLWYAIFAHLKILKGEPIAAEKLIDTAFELDPSDDLALELWFYLYAHYEKRRIPAEQEMNILLKQNIKSSVWGLQQNIVIAIYSGHPYPQKLEEYAKKITGE